MEQVKDTLRATVRIGYDGRVHKTFRGPKAEERFETEVRVLRHLQARGCPFVPTLLEAHPDRLTIVTTNCGSRVEHLDEARMREIYGELERYGVRHDDAELRNITYRRTDGRFCVIDFEFATILPDSDAPRIMDLHPKPPEPLRLRWYGVTDRGKVRPNNEDAFVAVQFDGAELRYLGKIGEDACGHNDFVFAVSDGMGGAMAGEYASRITVDKLTHLLPRSYKQKAVGLESGFADVLEEVFDQVHRALTYMGASYEECAGMGATLSLAWFTPGWMYFAHIGDSRIYYQSAREGTLRQITHDDTYVGWLFRKGELNEREARTHPRRNVLQRALGAGNQFVDPQVGAVSVEAGDRFLLCTDGVIEGLYDSGLLDLLTPANPLPPDWNPAQLLVTTAVQNAGRDNTTAVVVEVL